MLLVEDDPSQQQTFAAGFRARGYHVDIAHSGRMALDRAEVLRPAVAIVDLGLPDMDGLSVVRHLLLREVCPVIVVTADAVEDRMVEALDLGADDYVVKPYSLTVLEARVRRVLRSPRRAVSQTEEQLVESGDLRIDVGAHEAWVAGEPIRLQPLQFAVLVVLARNEGRVVTYQELSRAAYGEDRADRATADGLRTCVAGIRRQLGSGSRRPVIRTESRIGYRLTVDG